MINKLIHYCWFGRGEIPNMALKCIESWKKFLPDYRHKLWNEDNFDINSVPYVKQAYEAKKYAFVTDYVRLYALYYEGGIYMDTDVEVLKNLDRFLHHCAFSGFENESAIPTGIMASEQFGEWAKWQLTYYDNRQFILPDGSYDMTTNVSIISENMRQNGFIFNNTYQLIRGIAIYPKDYFCPKSHIDGKIVLTNNTYCIHHFAGSWKSKRSKFNHLIKKLLGIRLTQFYVKIKRKCFTYYS